MTDQEQIDALKAQVNRFKRGVESFNKTRSMNELLSAYIETPNQCLAEVKAKAIEDAIKACTVSYEDGLGGVESALNQNALLKYPNRLREQAK